MPGICSESCENLEKGEICKFYVSSFIVQGVTKIFLIYFFVISALSTQILIQSQINLGFHCFYLEITWKIHGILCHKRSGNPDILFLDQFSAV